MKFQWKFKKSSRSNLNFLLHNPSVCSLNRGLHGNLSDKLLIPHSNRTFFFKTNLNSDSLDLACNSRLKNHFVHHMFRFLNCIGSYWCIFIKNLHWLLQDLLKVSSSKKKKFLSFNPIMVMEGERDEDEMMLRNIGLCLNKMSWLLSLYLLKWIRNWVSDRLKRTQREKRSFKGKIEKLMEFCR